MVFLLFIPLYIFIVTEGVILYFLGRMIISAFIDNGYYSLMGTTYYTDISAMSIIGVLLLAIAVGLAIYFYIKLAIKPALKRARERKKSKEKKSRLLFIIWIIGTILLLIPVIAYIIYLFLFGGWSLSNAVQPNNNVPKVSSPSDINNTVQNTENETEEPTVEEETSEDNQENPTGEEETTVEEDTSEDNP